MADGDDFNGAAALADGQHIGTGDEALCSEDKSGSAEIGVTTQILPCGAQMLDGSGGG